MEFMTLILYFFGGLILLWIGYYIGSLVKDQEWENRLPSIRKESLDRSRAVMKGQFTEQLAPYLPDFPYNPSEVRFLGKPIDFLVFEGMDKGTIEKVVFVEVKTGSSRLSKAEQSLKDTIEGKQVRWEEYRKS